MCILVLLDVELEYFFLHNFSPKWTRKWKTEEKVADSSQETSHMSQKQTNFRQNIAKIGFNEWKTRKMEMICRLCLKKQSSFDLIDVFSENGEVKQLSRKVWELFRIEARVFFLLFYKFMNESNFFCSWLIRRTFRLLFVSSVTTNWRTIGRFCGLFWRIKSSWITFRKSN